MTYPWADLGAREISELSIRQK